MTIATTNINKTIQDIIKYVPYPTNVIEVAMAVEETQDYADKLKEGITHAVLTALNRILDRERQSWYGECLAQMLSSVAAEMLATGGLIMEKNHGEEKCNTYIKEHLDAISKAFGNQRKREG